MYVSGELPKPLTYLYDKEAMSLLFSDLLEKCEDIYESVTVSVAQAKLVEEATRKQSNCKIWFDQRSGRVSASPFEPICVSCQIYLLSWSNQVFFKGM